MDDKEEKAQKDCVYYVVEDENLDYYHKRNCDGGFCIIQDLFAKCYGRCKDYIYDDGKDAE